MAVLKSLPDPLPTLAVLRAEEVEDVVKNLDTIVQGINKAHGNIIEVVNDHAAAYDSGWSTTNVSTVKAADANGNLAHVGDVLGSLIDVLIAKGVLDA